MRICDFLLAINSNFGRTPAVYDKLTFKAIKWLGFPTPSLFDAPPPNRGALEFLYKTYLQKLERWGYRKVKIALS